MRLEIFLKFSKGFAVLEFYSFSCFDHYNVGFHNDSLVKQEVSGPILESKGKGTIFQKNGKEILSEGENLGTNVQNLKIF